VSTFSLVALIVIAHFADGTTLTKREVVATGLDQATCQRQSIYPPRQIPGATWTCELDQQPGD